jgi:hypothetical protein
MVLWDAARLPGTNTFTTSNVPALVRTVLLIGLRPVFAPRPSPKNGRIENSFFELLSVRDAHNRKNCRHENGTEPWACCNCDCTKRLEERLEQQGKPFLMKLDRG